MNIKSYKKVITCTADTISLILVSSSRNPLKIRLNHRNYLLACVWVQQNPPHVSQEGAGGPGWRPWPVWVVVHRWRDGGFRASARTTFVLVGEGSGAWREHGEHITTNEKRVDYDLFRIISHQSELKTPGRWRPGSPFPYCSSDVHRVLRGLRLCWDASDNAAPCCRVHSSHHSHTYRPGRPARTEERWLLHPYLQERK